MRLKMDINCIKIHKKNAFKAVHHITFSVAIFDQCT